MKLSSKEKKAGMISHVVRAGAIAMVVLLFMPGLNPARITKMIGDEASLLTSGFFYGTLTSGMGRAFTKGWINESSMILLFISCLICCLGVITAAVGACLTLGNLKCHRFANLLAMIGSGVAALSMTGVYIAYTQVAATSKPKKVEPVFPAGIYAVVIIALIVFAVALISNLVLPKASKEMKMKMESPYKLFLMLLPFLLLAFVFSYLPLWGWRYAFFDYKAGDTLSMSNFVGFKWFTYLFQNTATAKDIVMVLRNTLIMSGLGIATSWLPVAFAIFLNEIKNVKFRRVVQTLTTIPNFISWVLVYAVAFSIFSTDGFISSIMVNSGAWSQGVNMLMGNSNTWLKMLAWGLWKGLGWSAIIYIAAISGIDKGLYEAAKVDGAGRFQRMWHITVPSLIPTYCVLLLMSVASILSNGMDQYLVFKNATNASTITVLDLYVYNLGIVGGSIPLSTVVSMVKSIVSVILLFVANTISKVIRGESIV